MPERVVTKSPGHLATGLFCPRHPTKNWAGLTRLCDNLSRFCENRLWISGMNQWMLSTTMPGACWL